MVNIYSSKEACEYISKTKYISNAMLRYFVRKNIIKAKYLNNAYAFQKPELDKFIKNYKDR